MSESRSETKTRKMALMVILFSETLLVGCSVLITIGYHAYLCHRLRRDPCSTTMGWNSVKARSWFKQLNQADDKKGMLAVQSLRNALMGAILTSTVTIILTLCLGALLNNTFNAFDHFRSFFITDIDSASSDGFNRIIAVKFGSGLIFLITSFLSSCMGITYLIDANFLVNALGDFTGSDSGGECAKCHTESIVARGLRLVVLGNRVFYVACPLLLWMFGPVPMFLSSLALVWVLYLLDFPAAGMMPYQPTGDTRSWSN